jgi:hypothetical protein
MATGLVIQAGWKQPCVSTQDFLSQMDENVDLAMARL